MNYSTAWVQSANCFRRMGPESRAFVFESSHIARLPSFAATDSVGGLDHTAPILPDQGSSKPLEYWEDQLRKHQPRKRPPEAPTEKPAADDHQIDDYA